MSVHINQTLLKRYNNNLYIVVAFGLLLATVAQVTLVSKVNAVFSNIIVRVDRLQVSSATTGMICATPATAGTESKVVVTFPTGYTVSTTAANWAVSTTNNGWPTGATAWLGITTPGSAPSGQTVTFASGDLTVGTLYCFNWTNTAALTTGSSTSGATKGTVATQTSASADIDKSDFTSALVSADQLAVTATVPQSFSFSLSGTTDALGNLNTASVVSSPTPRVVTVSTNAKAGWNVWAKDSSTGLLSANATYTIASTTPGTNSTLGAGTEGYNTGVTTTHTTGAGTVSVATPFVGNATGKGGGLDATYRTLASSTGTAGADTVTLTNNVAISAITPAATDYTDTITVVGAGSF